MAQMFELLIHSVEYGDDIDSKAQMHSGCPSSGHSGAHGQPSPGGAARDEQHCAPGSFEGLLAPSAQYASGGEAGSIEEEFVKDTRVRRPRYGPTHPLGTRLKGNPMLIITVHARNTSWNV